MPPTVLFDSNIYFSAIVFGGLPLRCLQIGKANVVKIACCDLIITEVTRALNRKAGYSLDMATYQTLKETAQAIYLPTPSHCEAYTTNPGDNCILQAAVDGKVDMIVTGDRRHLLPLGSILRGFPS